ncbi:MAG TPA: polymer-forming cytoskeletal protein [Longimicrobium sp.]|jgi:cytoskeletal protein CcmA (bactofilin family)
MAFGRKSGDSASAPRISVPRGNGGETSMSIIGPGMRIVGDLTTDGAVRVEGEIRGTVRASKEVVIGREGLVEGEIYTQNAVIGGRVRGTVVAEARLELQASCDIEGVIHARAQHLHLEEGARFNGQVQMLDADGVRALPAVSGENSNPAEAFSTAH